MGRTPCCQKDGLKKGPWAPEEDQKLIGFINQHGHGNWRALPRKCGLLRCGKSCRLRWINYLRPDIKRGCFSYSEEQKIIQLHALVGNKWAFIASQLPNRTDNEIKNYWNTVLRNRLQKKGLIFTGTHQLHHEAGSENSSKRSNINVNTNLSMASISCSHLAQWESARLEAEARLARESKFSSIPSLNWAFGFNFRTSSSAIRPSIKSQIIKPHNQSGLSCLAFNSSQVNSIHDHMKHILVANRGTSTFSSSNINNTTSGSVSSSCQSVDVGSTKSSLSSPNRIISALYLQRSRNGRLSWKTPELSPFQSNDLISNSLRSSSQSASANNLDQAHEGEVVSPQKPRGNIMTNPTDDSLISLPLADLLFEGDKCSSSNRTCTWRSGKNEAIQREVENANAMVLKNNHNSHDMLIDNNLGYSIADCKNNNDSMEHSASRMVKDAMLPSKLSHHHHHPVVSTASNDAVGFTEGLNFHQFDSFLCDQNAAQLNDLLRELFYDTVDS